MENQTLGNAVRALLPAVLNDQISLSSAEQWVGTHNVSSEQLKASYIRNRGNREIIDAMIGDQDASNPAFCALTMEGV